MFKKINLCFFILASVHISACTCIGNSNFIKEFRGSKVVAVGHVIRLESVNIKSMKSEKTINLFKATLKLSKIYKGLPKDTLIVLTGHGHGDCGYPFKLNQEYIVYGNSKTLFDGELLLNSSGLDFVWTMICMRTMVYNSSEIKKLDSITSNPVLIDPQVPPTYALGSESDMIEFIQKELIVPKNISELSRVYISCGIDKSGIPKNIKIVKSLNREADQEALRVFKLLKFKPGYIQGQPVEMAYSLPFYFRTKSLEAAKIEPQK